ncbi:response regulator [Phaeodactylibacter sp.]|uniref:response regulator n=1 Tax=Phaeodactylibacter sp. TaxID=1940289 RepID=UPI0025DE27C7|nr:response regulator [Phaeodactylibacter sp.]MCI5090611.1 response regulator [Phaeodactylibacter sp.]
MNSKKYRLTFFVSVSFIGAMFIFYFLSLQNALKQNKDSAALINLAGRQRTHSQKIALQSLRFFYEIPQEDQKLIRQDLKESIARFNDAHLYLFDGSPGNHFHNPLNDSLTFAINNSIEDARKRLISNAYAIGFEGEKEASRLKMLFEDQQTFLSGMEQIVNRYEYNSSAQNDRLIVLNRTLLVLSLCLVGFIASFIMYPLLGQIASYTKKLRSLNDHLRNSNEDLAKAQSELVFQVNAMESINSALNMNALVSATDNKGTIIEANSKFAEVSGYSEAELLGNDHRMINSGYHDKAFWKDMWDTISQGKIWRGIVKNKAKNGSYYWVDSTITPIKGKDGQIEKYLSIRQDVTQRIQYEEELKAAKERAEAANIAKSSFLANMSHEIRTPLNSVIGFTDLLLKTKLNDTQQQYMSLIHQSGNILLDLINDILDFSKIEAGKLELSYERTDLWELVSQVGDIVKYKVNEKGIELLLNLSPNLPRYAWVDPVRIRQILVNLVGNAVKFTEEGEIEIGISALPGKDENGYQGLRFVVRDTGIGIAEERKDKILEAFTQEDNSTTRKYGGTGLGLTISNKLLHLMGSQLEIQSRLNLGSTFSFVAYFQTEEGDRNQWEGLSEIEHVLIVDDNPNNLHILKEMLHLQQVYTSSASNGITALEKLKQDSSIDVLITDYHMPYMDGIEVVRRIREELELTADDLKIILLHSSSDDRLINKACKKYKVFQQINKPITIQRLFDALSQVNQQQEDVPAIVASAPAPYATVESPSLRILIVDDNYVNVILARELINNILDQAEIHTAANGKSAVDKFQEVQPDLVLMDVQMPILNGYQATQAIRESERNGRTPIIALTAGTIKGERERCLQAGMDDYLSKPITASQLQQMLEKWLKMRQGPNPEEPGEAASTVAPKASMPVFNRSTLLERFGGNEAIVQEVIEEIWSVVRSGELRKDAEALQSALENGAPEQEIKAHAHKIKGTGLTASFDRLAKYAIDLEKLSPYEARTAQILSGRITNEVEVLEEMASKPA